MHILNHLHRRIPNRRMLAYIRDKQFNIARNVSARSWKPFKICPRQVWITFEAAFVCATPCDHQKTYFFIPGPPWKRPKGLQNLWHGHSKHSRRATSLANTIPLSKKITFFWPVHPWRRPQILQNRVQTLPKPTKMAYCMAFAYRYQFFISFGVSEGSFWGGN